MWLNLSRNLLLIFLLQVIVHADSCPLNKKEEKTLKKIIQKVELSENDIELFNLIPDDYTTFSKMFLYLKPIPQSPMINETFRLKANSILGTAEKCSGDYSGGAEEFFANIFLKMQKEYKQKWIQKSLSIIAGPWTGDWIYPDPFIGEVVDPSDPVLHNVLSEVNQDILIGLIIRYNTTNPRYLECERKYGLETVCPIILPDYVLQLPKNIQKRFEQAKDNLLTDHALCK